MMRTIASSKVYFIYHLPTWASDMAKRVIDITLSILALLFLAPFFGLIAWAIKRDSPGPVFYGGERVGKGGKLFKIWKFRTMYENPHSYQGPRVTAQDDPRITPIGHWLRNTKLNELPQFWNVLSGEMSLVGPRPEDPTFAKKWSKEVWDEILSVRPGITSPASVLYRNEERMLSKGSATSLYIQELGPAKMRLDQIYVRHRGFWLDLDTLFWTFLLLLPKIRDYNPPESLLFVGPVTRLARRYLNWFTIDAITTLAALGLFGLVWRFSGPLNLGWPRSIAFGVAYSLLYSLVGAVAGVNRIAWSKANFTDALDLIPAWLLATTITILYNAWARLLPAGLIVAASLLALGGFIVTRYRIRLLMVIFAWISRGLPGIHQAGERVLIIGSGPTAQHAAWLLTHPENSNKFWVVGFVDNDIFKQGTRIYGSDVLGTCHDVPEIIKKYDIGLVLIADHQQIGEDYLTVSHACRSAPIRYMVLPNLIDVFSHLGDLPLEIPITGLGTGLADHDDLPVIYGRVDCGDDHEDKDGPCRHCLARYLRWQEVMRSQGVKK